MSLDSNNQPIKKSIQEYNPTGLSSIFMATNKKINVVLVLQDDGTGKYSRFLKVTIYTSCAKDVSETIHKAGECSLINKRLNSEYKIKNIEYVNSLTDEENVSVIFRQGALYFVNSCDKESCEYTQSEYDLYDCRGRLVKQGMLVSNVIAEKCINEGYRLRILKDNKSSVGVDFAIRLGDCFPCTDYDRTPIIVGDARDNVLVNLKLNTGDNCKVIMKREFYCYLTKLLEKGIVLIDKQVLYVVDCSLEGDTNEPSTCYMGEDRLYLISTKDENYSKINKCFAYDVVLDDGSIMNVCCKNRLDRTTFNYFLYGATFKKIKDIYYIGKSAFVNNIISTDSYILKTKYRHIPIDVIISDSKHFNCCVTLSDYMKISNSKNIFYSSKESSGRVSDINPSKVCYNEGRVNCVVNDTQLATSLLILNE